MVAGASTDSELALEGAAEVFVEAMADEVVEDAIPQIC